MISYLYLCIYIYIIYIYIYAQHFSSFHELNPSLAPGQARHIRVESERRATVVRCHAASAALLALRRDGAWVERGAGAGAGSDFGGKTRGKL